MKLTDTISELAGLERELVRLRAEGGDNIFIAAAADHLEHEAFELAQTLPKPHHSVAREPDPEDPPRSGLGAACARARLKRETRLSST